MIAKNFAGNVTLEKCQDRLVIVSVQYGNYNLMIANVYAPNEATEKFRFFGTLQNILNKVSTSDLLVFGDFNCVMSNKLDIISGRPHGRVEVNTFNETMNSLNLHDVWRTFNGDEKEYTWNRFNPFIARRLDYCFVTDSILAHCVSCEHFSVPNTDHKCVVVELNNSDFVRGPGYWRFNNSYLKHPIFVKGMNALLDEITNENDDLSENCTDKWELCKVEIRDFCIEYVKSLACNRRNEILTLQTQLKKLEQQIRTDADNKEIYKNILDTKRKLELINIEKARGSQVRARTKWIEEGEKNTKYFCSLEKAAGRKKYYYTPSKFTWGNNH